MSHPSLKELTSGSEFVPEIKSNLALVQLDKIKQHAGQAHGLSLIAVSIIDKLSKGIEMDIRFENEIMMNDFVEQILGIWSVYNHISSYVRSFKLNGEFLAELDGKELLQTNDVPGSTDDFKGKKVIIDIESNKQDKQSYTFKLHLWGEVKPRVLNCMLVEV